MMKFWNKTKKKSAGLNFDSERLFLAASQSGKHIYTYFESRKRGLFQAEAAQRLKKVGKKKLYPKSEAVGSLC